MNYPFLPDRASDFADKMDPVFYILLGLTVLFTVLVLSFIFVLALRYRRGQNVNRKNPRHHNALLEMTWSVIPLILGLGVFVMAAIPYASVYHPPKNAIEIFVVGKRWMWHIQHANGARENNTLHIPVGKPIQLTMISQDVNHGFYVPAFRVKRDALPGRYNTMWFTPTKIGKFHLFCTEYCGTNHSEMIGSVYVQSPMDYAAWLANAGQEVEARHQSLETLGEVLYTQLACGTCHDKDGLGRGPTLTSLYGSKVMKKDGTSTIADDTYIRNSIFNPSDDIAAGYQQVMPSYKDQLTEEQILQVIAYIKSLNGSPPGARHLPNPGMSGTTGQKKSTGHGSISAPTQPAAAKTAEPSQQKKSGVDTMAPTDTLTAPKEATTAGKRI